MEADFLAPVFGVATGYAAGGLETGADVLKVFLTMEAECPICPRCGAREVVRKGKRFRRGPAKDNVRAKTGSLRHVGALSGYVTTEAGERLAFSILVNNFATEAVRPRHARRSTRWSRRSPPSPDAASEAASAWPRPCRRGST